MYLALQAVILGQALLLDRPLLPARSPWMAAATPVETQHAALTW
jgi:hypothetical protein